MSNITIGCIHIVIISPLICSQFTIKSAIHWYFIWSLNAFWKIFNYLLIFSFEWILPPKFGLSMQITSIQIQMEPFFCSLHWSSAVPTLSCVCWLSWFAASISTLFCQVLCSIQTSSSYSSRSRRLSPCVVFIVLSRSPLFLQAINRSR